MSGKTIIISALICVVVLPLGCKKATHDLGDNYVGDLVEEFTFYKKNVNFTITPQTDTLYVEFYREMRKLPQNKHFRNEMLVYIDRYSTAKCNRDFTLPDLDEDRMRVWIRYPNDSASTGNLRIVMVPERITDSLYLRLFRPTDIHNVYDTLIIRFNPEIVPEVVRDSSY